MNMLGVVANKKIIDVQRAFDARAKCFYNGFNFQTEKNNPFPALQVLNKFLQLSLETSYHKESQL